MAVSEDEEDLYGGSDLEELSVQAFNEIEEEALQATQASRAATRQANAALPEPTPTRLESAVNLNNVTRNVNVRPSKANGPRQPTAPGHGRSLQNGQRSGPENKTAQDAEPSEASQREQWRVNRFARPEEQAQQSQMNNRRTEDSANRMEVDLTGEDETDGDFDPHAQIRKLLEEREALKRSLQGARSEVRAKAGEIAIVRANHSKATKEFENRIHALESQHAEDSRKYKTELQKIEKDSARVTTENLFLQQDINREVERNKDLQRTGRNGTAKAQPSPAVTPRKSRSEAQGDGFDDVEILGVSPIRRERSIQQKPRTPKAGGKRKRVVTDDTPSPALQLSQSMIKTTLAEKQQSDLTSTVSTEIVPQVRPEDTRYDFFQMVINHRARPKSLRTIELFSTFHLPSNKTRSLSAIILDETFASREESKNAFPLQLMNVVLSVWSRCLEEKYHEPLMSLNELVSFILIQETTSLAPNILDEVLPVLQTTMDIVLIPRWKQADDTQIDKNISVTECLRVMHLVALGCAQHDRNTRRFFQLTRYDVILVLLSTKQHLSDVLMTLNLLAASIRPDSFGPLVGSGETYQHANEEHILDFLGIILVEPPRERTGKANYNAAELAQLRIAILRLLGAICTTAYGCRAHAKHPSVIGRLIRLAGDELDKVYDFKDGHEDSSTLINLAIPLVHHVCRQVPDVELATKMNSIPGGTHKRLVTLTRLNFSEGLLVEAGITKETVDAAGELLQNSITFEEGEALEAAMEKVRIRVR